MALAHGVATARLDVELQCREPNQGTNMQATEQLDMATQRVAATRRRGSRNLEVQPESPAAPAAETRLWLRLLACYNLVEVELRGRLRSNFDSTLARFDVLAQIARPPEGLTMSQLSQRLMVTKGNMTDVIGRLEAERLVERHRDADDARVQRVYLTAAGKRTVNKMLPAHNVWLAELMRDFDRDDTQALTELLGKLRTALRSARDG